MTGQNPQPRGGLVARFLVMLVRGYQLVVSAWFAPTCRYYPSCSAYAITALRTHGAIRGTALAAWRLLRCNPWSRGGVDHVPPRGGLARGRAPGRGGGSDDSPAHSAGSAEAANAAVQAAGTRPPGISTDSEGTLGSRTSRPDSPARPAR